MQPAERFKYLKEKAARALAVPQELALDMPLVLLTGRTEVNIENYKKLLEFGDTLIKIQTKAGTLTISGARLALASLTSENAIIRGSITGISYA